MRDKRGRRVRSVEGRPMDYTDPRDFPKAAAVQAKRRGGADHEYVVGGFRLDGERVVLACVYCGPAWNIEERLTVEAARFARWRTKQAAWSWLQLRPWMDGVRVIHLGRLDVLDLPPDPH